jgi:ATP adenylyltransferase/5',5'''-P-1,P-4-tetraphosphate phosphorylase II
MNCELKLQEKVNELFEQQLSVWEMARNNFEGLKTVQIREFDFDGFAVKVQFNPARMVSSGAKVDAKTIAQRKCFLCAANRPEVQRGIEWRDYDILINPFPIFTRHLTIPRREHVDQQLVPYISDMFDLARELPDFVVFYNGPKCGASAPDHMHFQAGNADFLPLVDDYFNLKQAGRTELVDAVGATNTYLLNNYLRVVYCIESADADALKEAFMKLYNLWVKEEGVEPMMNVVCLYRDAKWYLFIIPRGAFRPWQYTAEGDKQLLVSPATVEVSGLFITPVKEHFERITKEDVVDILTQCSY